MKDEGKTKQNKSRELVLCLKKFNIGLCVSNTVVEGRRRILDRPLNLLTTKQDQKERARRMQALFYFILFLSFFFFGKTQSILVHGRKIQ